MNRFLLSTCFAGLVLAPGAAAQDVPGLLPVGEFSGRFGTGERGGRLGFMLPYLTQSGSVVFGDVGISVDADEFVGASLGLGYRLPAGADWVLGSSFFYDYLYTERGNDFHELSLGLEALSRDLEFRVNGYLPIGDTDAVEDDLNRAYVDAGELLFRRGEEQALHGVDGEIGIRLPVFGPDSDTQLRVFGGGFLFDGDGIDADPGLTGRAELSFASLPGLAPGATFTIGAAASYSRENDEEFGLLERLRIPFGAAAGRNAETDPALRRVERASRIRTHAGATGDIEAALYADTGEAVGPVVEVGSEDTGASINADLLAAGGNGLILANGDIDVESTLTLQGGQRVVGGGGSVAVLGAESGGSATFRVRGPAATFNGTNASADVFAMADDSVISTLSVTGGRSGIAATGVGNIRISDVGIDATGLRGIDLFDVDGVLIEDVSITNLNDDEGTFSYTDPYIDYASINAVGVRNATFRDIVADTARTGLFINSIWASGDDPELDAPAIYSENISVENLTVRNTTGEAIFMVASRFLDFDNVSTFNIETPGYELDQFTILSSSDVTARNLNINGGSNGIMVVSPLADLSQRLSFEDVTITGTGRAGIFLNGSDDVSFSDVRIVSPGTPTSSFTAAVYLYGDFITPVSNVTFDNVTVVDSEIPLLTPSGDLENINGNIVGTGNSADCETFYYSLTQAPGNALAVNGTALPPGMQFSCP